VTKRAAVDADSAPQSTTCVPPKADDGYAPFLDRMDQLPKPQADALASAFGIRGSAARPIHDQPGRADPADGRYGPMHAPRGISTPGTQPTSANGLQRRAVRSPHHTPE
jgi:hypothetical protein